MKKITITSMMLLTALFAVASHQNSELLLSSSKNDLLIVTLDNKVYSQPAREFQINGLLPGDHYLTVSKISHRNPSRVQNKKTIYRGTIFIPSASRITALVEDRFRLNIVDIEPLYKFNWNTNNEPGNRHRDSDPGFCGTSSAMDGNSFFQLKRSIESKSFESTRLQVAQQAAAGNYFTSNQVCELLALFTFESTKLEFAKHAFSRTVDQGNYYLVNDAFTFESSIGELNEYIMHRS